MRILHILNHVGKTGNGITNVAVDLACLQSRAGHEVWVISSGGDFVRLFQQHGVHHVQLDFTRTPQALLNTLQRLYTEIRHARPDIIHAHMMTGVVLVKALKTFLPYPLVTHVHNEFQRSAILMGLGNRVIAVSRAVAESMQKRGVSRAKIRIVPNSTLGSPRHRPLQTYQAADLNHPAIITVAGMYQRKGIFELLEAFEGVAARVPEAHLYLVGDGHDRKLFEERAHHSLFRDRIHFEGFKEEPQPYFLAADIFVLASHREPFGLVITEAREAGCAIVASNVDGIPEALNNGAAGILVPPQDAASLREKLIELLMDRNLLQRWRIKAQHDVHRFTLRHVVHEVEKVYLELVSPSVVEAEKARRQFDESSA